MATASYTLAPGYSLTGSTSGTSSAPIMYSINGIVVGSEVIGGGFNFFYYENDDGTYTLKVNGIVIGTTFSEATVATLTDNLRNATASISNSIAQQVLVAAPAPAPTSTFVQAPAPTVTETSTSVITNTNGFDIVVDKAPVVTETSTSVITRTGGFDIVVDKPASLTVDAVEASNADLSVISKPSTVTQADVTASNGDLTNIATSPNATTPDTTPKVISIAADQDATQFSARSDWRVRLALTDDTGANYMYRASNPGILAPLKATNGVIFPYTPTVSVNYAASYDQTPVVHSNYTVYQYSRSSVDSVQITGDFTAQDTHEANYLLAVIHFFRSMTKMFYGQDQNPKRGTPPPLCYLFGMGTFQFSAHPLAIAGFSYNLPNDVDYIKTVSSYSPGAQQPSNNTGAKPSRLPPGISTGGKAALPNFSSPSSNQTGEVTWVPTKIQLTISCLPMQSRNQVSNKFSLEKYASGDLLNGIKNPGGAFW